MLLPVQLWAAHAIVLFLHEYAHSTVAWLLGWKASPLDLDYAHPTLTVLLLQFGINQKVDEAPIFASGHAVDVGLIAAAGMVIGNGLISLPLSRLAYRAALVRIRPALALLAYWATVASIGNLIDYVPIRTFTLGSDMGSVQKGFGWSPWTVLVLFGAPTLLATLWFFGRIVPEMLASVFPDSPGKRRLIAVLTVMAIFGFYGAAGLGDDPVPNRFSMISLLVVLPIGIVVAFVRVARRPASPELV